MGFAGGAGCGVFLRAWVVLLSGLRSWFSLLCCGWFWCGLGRVLRGRCVLAGVSERGGIPYRAG